MMLPVVIKRYVVLTACLFFGNSFLRAQEDTIIQRIVLIGDAGQLSANGRHPVVEAVKNYIKLDKKTTVLYLGDNLYKVGLPEEEFETYKKARAVLDSQISVVDGTEAQVLMIPGNHDWENGGRGGYDAVIREQLYVDFLAVDKKTKIKFQPEDGCPGPVEVKLGDDVVIILFDSQWWLHPHDKPEIESDCNCKTEEELVSQIEDLAARNSKKLVILACHHPFKSNGPHGGFFTLKQHIFPLTDMKANLYIPLPIIGSIYPIERSVFGTPQDVNHPVYQNMINRISTVVKAAAPNVIFVAGHEHNLQHIKDSSYHYIVSGGGCKDSRVSKSKNSPYINEAHGFAVVEVSKNKNVTLDFYTVVDSVKKDYTATLLNFSKIPDVIVDSASENRVIEDPFLKYKDTLTISASDRFPVVGGLKKFFMGQNYRPEWSQPVNMKVFNISKEQGGFTIASLGGGKQTTSLRLVNKVNGKEYVLRNMVKNPTRDIPESFQGSLAADLVAELNSAAHPYAAFIVPGLAKPLEIPVASPQLFFVPDDPALGFYRALFKNTVCMLEERHATLDGTNTVSTAKLFSKMLDENDHRPIEPMVLQARLLDILLADYARHFDQWRWGIQDTGKGKIYYPIPRDRDQALFYSDGQLLGVVSGRVMPFLKGFRSDIPRVKWLGYSARDFDRFFLSALGKEQWEKAISDLQHDLSDSVIRKAVMRLPPEIFAIDGETIIKKLISRRNLLSREGMRYYNYISRQVNVVGSNLKEYFKISNHEKGLQIRVYALQKGKDTSFIMFDRVFDASVTHEIRLYGLNDEDVFDIEENASSRIKLRLIGGRGNDTFDIRGNVENLLYDLNVEGNLIKNKSRTKNRFSADPPANARSILGFEYNRTRFPQFAAGFNTDDGLLGGTGISRRTYGFRNFPYATDHRLAILWSLTKKAWQFRYRGEINHVSRSIDLVINANYSTPALRNFFGMGNKTTIDPSKKTTFYQTRYSALQFEAMLRRRYFDKFHIQAGPYLFMYNAKYSDNVDNVLGKFRDFQLDSQIIFSRKTYVGGKLALILDNRNNELIPTRGMLWTNEILVTKGMGTGAHNFISYTTDMKVYASLSEPAKLVAILKMGGGRIYSKYFEYFQAMTFGANNSLYSFRKNRYAGRGSIYGSLETRIKITDVDSYILPGVLGFTVFFDIGRIYHKVLPGRAWHTGYGGGLYYVPFNLFVITATAGFSEGENVFNFSLGTRINLTF